MSEMRKRLQKPSGPYRGGGTEVVFLSARVFQGHRQLPACPGRIQILSTGLPLSKALPPKASLTPRLTQLGMQPAHGTALWIVLCCCQHDLLPPAQVKGFPPLEFLWDSFVIACIAQISPALAWSWHLLSNITSALCLGLFVFTCSCQMEQYLCFHNSCLPLSCQTQVFVAQENESKKVD